MALSYGRKVIAGVAGLGLIFGLTACSGGAGTVQTVGKNDTVHVTLILKDLVNPYFVALEKGAQAQAKKDNVKLTIAAGAKDGDEQGQIQAIEDAVTRGDNGILILPSGPGVNDAIKKARAAGLTVIGLDTPTDPADVVDRTFATDNFVAGTQIGQWAAKKMDGKAADIALLDQFNDRVIETDLNRDQGFLTGMGIDTVDKKNFGDEAKTGKYSGGTYKIACQEPTGGAQDGGRTAMETCLSKDPGINLVYTINEPAAAGAYAAIKAAGLQNKITIVSIDGSCTGVKLVSDGQLGATSMQFPVVMAQRGVATVASVARGGKVPAASSGLDYFNTGTELVAKDALGLTADTAEAAATRCWG